MVKKIKESRFGRLIESELEKAELVLAAKAITEKLQNMARDVARMEANDLMPILDQLRFTFGGELAGKFNETASSKLRDLLTNIKDTKTAIENQIMRLENIVNGNGNDNDMASDSFDDEDNGASVGGNESDDMEMPDQADMSNDMPEKPSSAVSDMERGEEKLAGANPAGRALKSESFKPTRRSIT